MNIPTLTDIPAEAEVHAATTGSLLRLATAGSVNNGKSTLVGRLLLGSESMLRGQLAVAEQVSLDRGLISVDLALLIDSLRAGREQGITIDVAYRYPTTPQRSFILTDYPGYVWYTHSTVTGCSTADIVVLLVDACNGVLEQTRRHLAVAALLRVPHVIVTVNKIDLANFSAEVYAIVEADIRVMVVELGVVGIHVLPTSTPLGDNIAEAPTSAPFYEESTLLGFLESLPTAREEGTLRLSVQLVIRPQGTASTPESRDRRGYAGWIASGTVRAGDPVVVLPSGRHPYMTGIDLGECNLEEAAEGQPVTVRLTDDIDTARGDTLATTGDAPQVLTGIDTRTSWLSEEPLRPQVRVLLKHGAQAVQAIMRVIDGHLDLDNLITVSVDRPKFNDIDLVRLRLASLVPLADYSIFRSDGAFLLTSAHKGGTLGAGMMQLADAGCAEPAAAVSSDRG